MGRKPKNPIVKCRICGKPSYLRDRHPSRNPQIENDRYRKYSRWEHIDKKAKPKTHYKRIIDAEEYKELLKQISISDERFLEVNSNTNDVIPLLKHYALTIEQLNQLPIIEQREYLHSRDIEVAKKTDSEIKDKIQRIEQKKLRELSGIKSMKEEQRKSTIIPPKEYWGESGTRSLFLKWSKEFNIVSKCLSKPSWKDSAAREGQTEVSRLFKVLSNQMNKMASLTYHFRPAIPGHDDGLIHIGPDDSQMSENYNQWYERRIKLLYSLLEWLGLQLGLATKQINKPNEEISNEQKKDIKLQFELISDVLRMYMTYYKYIVDERYLLPFSRWKKIFVDRHENYTIRGAAAVNYLLTGQTVGKLRTNQEEIDKAKKEGRPEPKLKYTVVEIPIKTTLPAKQIKNMTKIPTAEQIKNMTRRDGPVFSDIVNELRGQKAEMILGLTEEKDKQV